MRSRFTLVRRTSAWADCSIWRAWERLRGQSATGHNKHRKQIAHLAVAAEKKFREAAPFDFKRCRIGARLLNRCARHMTGGRWLTLVDRVANLIPFCEVRVRARSHFAPANALGLQSTPPLHKGCAYIGAVTFDAGPLLSALSSRPADSASLGLPAIDAHVAGALAPPSKGIMSLFRRTS